ncbi:MAG: YigZ family protein [Oscillospiraceae bacterium]|nr:YigZ family protein [Oscillospiraceae bacterium]
MDEYRIPTKDAEAELIEKKSRFIGHIFVTETEEEALFYLKEMRDTYWDATHNVYAYIIKDGPTRFSDDGEPGGTAGMPVLNVLQQEKVFNVLCVVTRYFGGTLLGTGGLVRAYSKSAKLALEAAGISHKRVWDKLVIPCPYNLFEQVKKEITAKGGMILDTVFGAGVDIIAIFPAAETEVFVKRLTDLSSGRIEVQPIGQEYRAFPIEN